MQWLVDGDLASNQHGWQWTAGCGTDAAPYFRVFNPTTQGAKFDPDGVYVRRWVPELRDVDDQARPRAVDGAGRRARRATPSRSSTTRRSGSRRSAALREGSSDDRRAGRPGPVQRSGPLRQRRLRRSARWPRACPARGPDAVEVTPAAAAAARHADDGRDRGGRDELARRRHRRRGPRRRRDLEPVDKVAPDVAAAAMLPTPACPSTRSRGASPAGPTAPRATVCGSSRDRSAGTAGTSRRCGCRDASTGGARSRPAGATTVGPAVTWAALDCVGGWSQDLAGRPCVLGRMTARLDALPAVGEPHVVVGRHLGDDGRKSFTASTLYDRTAGSSPARGTPGSRSTRRPSTSRDAAAACRTGVVLPTVGEVEAEGRGPWT